MKPPDGAWRMWAAALYPPPAGGGLIEACAAARCRRCRTRVSPARGRGPH